DDMTFNPVTALGAPGGQFPENKVWFQRLDATAVYKFDHDQVAAMGFKGDLKAKLNYTWERSSETNWANDPMSLSNASSLYAGTGAATGVWMGWYNPNY